ncbi:tripartite tricarboxylate transporter substrate binding protein [Alcaligenaceae bacterium]|nr:tripartite tricarboxylate transporter substrate binding protein [Alcaligenaceae bacterium]
MQQKRKFLGAVCAIAVSLSLPMSAWADSSFPSRAIKLVVPYGAGGTIDLMARVIGPKLTEVLKQPVIIENRAGGGTTIGADYVARADADGYTIFMGSNAAFTISPQLLPKIPYSPLESFAAIGTVASFPNLILVKPDSPYKTLGDIIQAARNAPNSLSYATFGIGSTAEITGEAIKAAAKVDIPEIPYKSGAQSVQAILAGEVDYGFDTAVGSVPRVKNGQLRAIAVTSAQRYAALPDVPSITEAGYPDAEVIAWVGVFTPAATPAPIQKALADAFQAASANPELKERFNQMGVEVKFVDGDQTMKNLKIEYERVGNVLKQANIKLD